jgi:hypothetical protein
LSRCVDILVFFDWATVWATFFKKLGDFLNLLVTLGMSVVDTKI